MHLFIVPHNTGLGSAPLAELLLLMSQELWVQDSCHFLYSTFFVRGQLHTGTNNC